jgi:glycosyltransferase involved in cell wall biosynthesis
VSPTIEQMAGEMADAGVRRVHVLAWRDLDDADAGGSEAHADHFMRRWAAAGLEITHRTSHAPGLPKITERHGYRVVRRGSRYSVFGRVVASEATGRMGPFDAVVEVWNGVPWLSPLWRRGKPQLTILHHIHGRMWDQLLPRPMAAAGRTMEARVAPRLYRRSMTITAGEEPRRELLELGFRPDKVLVVPHGVDPSFSPGGDRHPTPLVVSVGRLAPVKRHEELIGAALVARRSIPDLELVIVGDGPLMPALRTLVADRGARRWITLAGKVSDSELVELYRRAWLVASASLAEGWGLTLTEAAACATPAVATDIAGHRASVVPGVTGELVPLDRLGPALADLLADGERRARLAAGALCRSRQLTWDESARRILAALHAQVSLR